MKIQITQSQSGDGRVFVKGVWGPKTIKWLLTEINKDIKDVNKTLKELGSLYE
jgi:hypothetical protein